ncbi:NUDIX hydrolase [Halalkalibacter urbisdiaboli]|uniref:NUDIX hydrolase n=1 Tax=Halalkalibacter urbisdiaboli TaxID=1960589 RepID=UPI000B446FFA|nr:NUDIX hydrolase [Halalkalibacter urbisdiaboli]
MDNEMIEIFDEYKKSLGVASRRDVHKNGYWHQTFHCWFVGVEKGVEYIFFQIRSDMKKDFPTLLDITAAGHILAHETMDDGIREVKEELGVDVSFNELTELGVIEDCIINDNFVDNEFANVFLYRSNKLKDKYILQKEEVSGIVKTEFKDFYNLCFGYIDEVLINGFKIDTFGKEIPIEKKVNRLDFVPHPDTYLKKVAKLIKESL